MKLARVFPTRTSMSPTDPDAYFGLPMMFMPKYDEIHISVTFTWDIPKARRLAKEWERYGNVRIGGVAIDGESAQPMIPGRYIKEGVTITSRGCPNNCSFCLVKLPVIEFDDFPAGNIVQDNNILACSDRHWRLVLSMLKTQKQIEFKGGLEKRRVTGKIAEDLRGLKIRSIWLACDQPGSIEPLKRAVNILNKAGFTRNHLFCFVLIGDDMTENEARLREVFNIGCLPFAQLYKDKDNSVQYSWEWRSFARSWCRPAAIKSIMKGEKTDALS